MVFLKRIFVRGKSMLEKNNQRKAHFQTKKTLPKIVAPVYFLVKKTKILPLNKNVSLKILIKIASSV